MAGGPGGVQVGRVNIKVVPDFTHFRKLMNAVLKEYSAKTIDVKVRADDKALDGLSRDLAATGRNASKAMSDEISKGLKKAGKDAKIAPTLDSKARFKRRMQSDINKVFEQIEIGLNLKGGSSAAVRDFWDKELAQVQKQWDKLDLDLDSRAFNAQAAYVIATLNKIRNESIKLRNDLNLGKGELVNRASNEAGLRAIRDSILETKRLAAAAEESSKKVDEAFNSLKGGWREQRAQLRTILGEYIYGFRTLNGEVLKVTSNANFQRMRGGVLGALFGGAAAISGAKTAVNIIGKAGSAITGLTDKVSKFMPSFGSGISFTGYLLLASLLMPVLATLSGIIVAAPAALAAISVPIAAIALGVEGIKKAAETAKPAFEQMRKDISGVFEKGMIPGFETFRDTIIPGLTESFKGVAGSLSGLFNDFTANLAKEQNMSNLNKIIDNVSAAIDRAKPGIRDFTDGILDLVGTLSEKFPGISDALNRTGASFVKWVDKITTVDASGTSQLDRAMTTLGDTLSGLGGIVSDLFAKGFDDLGNVSFGDSMRSFIADINSLINETLPALSNAFQGIATALKPITWLVEKAAQIGDSDFVNAFKNPETSKSFADQSVMTKLLGGLGANFEDQLKAWWNGTEWAGPNGAWATAEGQNIGKSLGQATAEAAAQATQAALAQNTEMFANQPWALGNLGIDSQIQNQLTTQSMTAINGARQALTPLFGQLQTDINNALTPLGDIAGRVAAAFGDVPGQVQASLGKVPGIVSQSLGSLGGVAALAMSGLVTAVKQACDNAQLTATFMAPQIIQPFRDLAGQMAGIAADMMTGLASGIKDNVGIAKEAAAAAATEMKDAAKAAIRSKSPSKDFMDIGKDTQTGLAIGIGNNAAGPISAIKEVMLAIKEVFGSAEGLNLNFYMGDAAKSMSSMATSSKEFRTNMVEAGTSPAVSSGLDTSTTDLADIKRQKAEIDLRLAELTAQKNATQDKAAKSALTAEMDQLRIQKERLDLLKEESGLQEERKTAIQKLSDTIATNITDMIKMPGEFAKTTANAAMQDLGISGSGAIPTIANWALDAGTNFIFNVNNMDDAIQGQQAQQSKQVAGVVSR